MAGKARTVVTLKVDQETHDIKSSHQYFVLLDMINTAHAHNREICVISITGLFRSGKSFLLSLLYTYLDYLHQKNGSDEGWEEKKETPIKGLKWAKGQKAVTNGITMLMYPKPIRGKGVLLMDCQGTGDINMSSTTLDNHILFLGLQLSDVLILNVSGQLASTDLDRLKLCTEYADGESKGKIFENLVFLIRNWEADDEPKSIQKMYDEAESKSVRDCAQGIMNAFKDVQVVGLESPAKRFGNKSSTDNIKFKDVDESFLVSVKTLFRQLLQPLSSKPRFTAQTLLEEFRILSRRPINVVRTPQDQFDEMAVWRVFDTSKELLNDRLEKLLSAHDAKSPSDMEREITRIFDDVLENSFLSDSRVKDYAKPDQTRKLEKHLRDIHEVFLNKFQRMKEMKTVERERERQKQTAYDRRKSRKMLSQYKQQVEEERLAGNLLTDLHAARFLRLLSRSEDEGFVETVDDLVEEESVKSVQVRALYNHEGDNEVELSYNKGDVIDMMREVDKEWGFGTLRGNMGFFIQSNCERV